MSADVICFASYRAKRRAQAILRYLQANPTATVGEAQRRCNTENTPPNTKKDRYHVTWNRNERS